MTITALPAIMQYSFSPCPLLSKLSDLGMYLIAAVSAVTVCLSSLFAKADAPVSQTDLLKLIPLVGD
ncbi:MAG: hypothetical protein V7L11_17055 [Nostoc sp.]|uniref:hypothetical protein n=1 Tax=Nostoc sp. TaxID=1180 RepID=UPI002FFA67D1